MTSTAPSAAAPCNSLTPTSLKRGNKEKQKATEEESFEVYQSL
jgi:hypothetical protein